MYLLFPILALCTTLAMTSAAHAQDGASASLQVTFGHSPHWVGVQGTRVREIRTTDRPNYDMFRYGRSYYVYNNNRWYSSRRSNGRFRAIDDRNVPTEISRVPRDHWHNYPSSWQDQNRGPRSGDDSQRH
jgi:hypothetical protein